LAEAGGISISGTAYDQIKNKLTLGYDFVGEQTVKNIKEPVRVYRVRMDPEAASEKKAKPRQWQMATMGLVVTVIVVVAAIVIWKFYIPPAPQPEVASKEKITAAPSEKPSVTVPSSPAPSVAPALKEKVTPPLPEKVTKPAPPPAPKMEVASKGKMAFPLPDKPSIAVLPFVNMSDDPKQEFFSDGISEDIINALVRWPPVWVIPRASSFTYKGKSVDMKQVGREMGVRYVLEGSVRREGNRVRITVQLIDATTLQHLFSERYEREMKDIFAIQDEITMKVLTAMQVSLYGFGNQLLPEKGTKNIEAYVKILEADVHIQIMNRASQAQAKQLAEEAIALDPEYARAYSRLAGVIGNEFLLGVYEKNPREALERAMALAQKAIQLDDSASDAHSVLGYMALLNRDYDKAIAETERAVALTPNSVAAQYRLGYCLYSAGRTEEAIPILKKAVALSPIPLPRALSHLCIASRKARRYEEAVAVCRQLLQREPNHVLAHLTLGATFVEIEKMEEARAEITEVLRIDPKYSVKGVPRSFPWKDQAEIDRLIDSLRKAGLK